MNKLNELLIEQNGTNVLKTDNPKYISSNKTVDERAVNEGATDC